MNRVQAALAAARIELHWAIILRYRRRGCRLIERGEPLTSLRLQRYTRIIDRHGRLAYQLESLFE